MNLRDLVPGITPFHEEEAGCRCGCGQIVARGKQFISGHNLRVIVKTDLHKNNLRQAIKGVWDLGKRTRIPVGSKRIRNGVEQIRVKSENGWIYWIANNPDALRRHNKQCHKPNQSDKQLIDKYNGDWHKLTTKQRYRLRQKGIDIPNYYGHHLKGKPKSIEHRQKIAEGHRKYPFDKRAIESKAKNRVRRSAEYRGWRTSIFEKDNYTCQECGAKNGNGKTIYLEAHHIKSYTYFPGLRFDVENGLTLCKGCHKRVNKEQMIGNKNGIKRNNREYSN